MVELVAGLILFLGAHSMRIFDEAGRARAIAHFGEMPYTLGVTILSLIGFGLLWHGYGLARLAPQMIWVPPLAARHIAAPLMLVAIIFLVAAHVPANHIKAKLRHPMILSVKIWALAHLLANGTLADVVLFGSFLLWAIFDFRTARQRDRLLFDRPATPAVDQPTPATVVAAPAASVKGTVLTIVLGAALWMFFVVYLHQKLIGVSPLGV